MMEYTFCFVQTTPKCPKTVGWYLYVNTIEILEKALIDNAPKRYNLSAGIIEFLKFRTSDSKRHEPLGRWNNHYAELLALGESLGKIPGKPIGQTDKKRITFIELAQYVSETYLSPKYEAIIKHDGIYLNANRMGYFEKGTGERVIKTIKSSTLKWPDENEEITISKWANGSHWYLTSTIGRVFSPDSYLDLDEAIGIAGKHVDKDKVKVKEPEFVYSREGD